MDKGRKISMEHEFVAEVVSAHELLFSWLVIAFGFFNTRMWELESDSFCRFPLNRFMHSTSGTQKAATLCTAALEVPLVRQGPPYCTEQVYRVEAYGFYRYYQRMFYFAIAPYGKEIAFADVADRRYLVVSFWGTISPKDVHVDFRYEYVRIGEGYTHLGIKDLAGGFVKDWDTRMCEIMDMHGVESTNMVNTKYPTS
ncbi:UNVERIFIED_CONTAM: hypothetical protein PYX00_011804 [Menopon gallinae]|uniref:Uncharacterized protein n=1 Tax=Menopon gallinae TaxID=328185 RepID=A0AAW2H981_9NEOP